MPGKNSDRGVAHDIVVIGASAGGIEALTMFVADLPRQLPAAICVVVHISPDVPSFLPQILSRSGPLPATTAWDQAPIEQGHIYIAPPDRHLLLTRDETRDEMRVVYGPRENRHRPAIDPLFRSAALAFGPRVVGIILSGALNDGTAGLLAIKRAGGVALVQDPATATFPGMPESALTYAPVDWVSPVAGLAEKVVSLAAAAQPERKGAVPVPDEMDDEQKTEMQLETDIAGLKPDVVANPRRYGKLSSYTCPDCHGPLWEIQDGQLLRFRCRVGHAFTAESMFEGQDANIEEARGMALNTLEESQELYTRLAAQSREHQRPLLAQQFVRMAAEHAKRASVLRKLLEPEATGQESSSATSVSTDSAESPVP